MDEEALQFYRSNALAYAGREAARHTRLNRFLALLVPGATVDAGGWSSLSIETREVRGFDSKQAQMLFVMARKSL